MKIRITELLDDYYDNTVKLEEPSRSAQAQPEAPKKRQSRMQKPLLVAATLMLVVTGAVALGLCFQSKTPGGGALAAGDTPASSVEDAASPTPEVTPTPTTEAAPTPTTEAAPTPTTETAAEWETVEYVDAALLSYAQQWDQLSFTMALSPVSADMAEAAPTATDIDTDASIDGICLMEGSYDAELETLYLTGSATLQTGTYLGFTVRLTLDGHTVMASIPDSMIELTAPENYLLVENRGCIYEFSVETPEETARVTRMELRPDSVTFRYDFPAQGMTGDSLLPWAMEWSTVLADSLQNNFIQFLYGNGTAATEFLDLPWDKTTEIIEDADADSGMATAEVTIDWGENAIDPPNIAELTFDGDPLVSSDWSCYEGEITAEDPNGDGLLTVELNLSSEYGTLTRFVLDLTTNLYAWYIDIPEARDMVEEAGGDFSAVLGTEAFDDLYLPIYNGLQTDYLSDVSILCTDGTGMNIASGELLGYADGMFMMYDHLLITLEGSDDALNGREPAALVIGGVRYEFE